jgi:hypothetical protein
MIGFEFLQQSLLDQLTIAGFEQHWYHKFFQPQKTHAVDNYCERRVHWEPAFLGDPVKRLRRIGDRHV